MHLGQQLNLNVKKHDVSSKKYVCMYVLCVGGGGYSPPTPYSDVPDQCTNMYKVNRTYICCLRGAHNTRRSHTQSRARSLLARAGSPATGYV